MAQITTFNYSHNMSSRLIISRFELYPKENPRNYIVGFKIICDTNAKEGYVESTVALEDITDQSDHDICVLGYRNAKDKIQATMTKLESITPVLGAEFIIPEGE